MAEDPRWERTYESYSSNAELVKTISSSYAQGLVDGGVVACAKHFIGDGGVSYGTGEKSEGYERLIDRGNAELSEDEIAEQLAIYQSLIEKGVQSIMVSHSALNGVKMHENTHYLTDVLRGEMGVEGVIVSDWNSVQNITSTTDYKQQIITCVNAGVDWLMDEAVTRIIQLKLDAGLFDDPYLDNISTVQKETGSQEYRELGDSLGKPIVTLIVAGRNVIIDEYKDKWSGIVMCGLPGSEGSGVANVLVGKAPFTGKLPMPWYANVNDISNGNVWLEQGFGLE